MSDSNQYVPSTLRGLLSGGGPVVAVSFTGHESDSQIRGAFDAGADVAELRIDRFESLEHDQVSATVGRFGDVPTIATIRHCDEGGEWSGSDAERDQLFQLVLAHVDGIDIELSSVEHHGALFVAARQQDKVLIASHHDFDSTPATTALEDMLTQSKSAGVDLFKIAAWAASSDDLRSLTDFTIRHVDAGLVVIGMGPYGSVSRVILPVLGSRLAFAATSHPIPGQLDLADTVQLLQRFSPEFSRRTHTRAAHVEATG